MMVEGGDCFEPRSALLAARAAAKINAVCAVWQRSGPLPGVSCHLVFRDKPSDGDKQMDARRTDEERQGPNRVRPLAGHAAPPPAR